MIIYRVECKLNKRGMYQWEGGCPPWPNCNERNPGSYRDIPGFNNLKHDTWRHGFCSIEMLWRWFHKNDDYLRRTLMQGSYYQDGNALRIMRYIVPDEHAVIGSCQVIFDHNFAEDAGTIPVTQVVAMALGGREEVEATFRITNEGRIHDQCYFTIEPLERSKPVQNKKPWVQMNQPPKSARKYA